MDGPGRDPGLNTRRANRPTGSAQHGRVQKMPAHAARHDDHEIETIEEFDATVSARGTLSGFHVRAVDLTNRTREPLATSAAGAVFLGCPMREEAAA